MTKFSSRRSRIERWREKYARAVCQWVPDRRTLELISGDKGMRLHPAILEKWTSAAIAAYVLRTRGEPVGFATIGRHEWPLPDGLCEIGHLIIRPDYRRHYFSVILLTGLCRVIQQRGFKAAVARTALDNNAAQRMLRKAGFVEIHENWCGHNFLWFIKHF